MQNIWAGFVKWWQQPLKAQATAPQWFLFTGFILCVLFLWSLILKEAGHVIEEV